LAEVKQYKVGREKEKRSRINGNTLPTTDGLNLKKFLETEAGMDKKEKDREEFKTLFDTQSDPESDMDEDEPVEEEPEIEPEVDVSKITKKVKTELAKGKRDQIEEFNIEDF
jgi:hypothetical protein